MLKDIIIFFAGALTGIFFLALCIVGRKERSLPKLPDFDEWSKNRDYVPMWFLEKWFGDNYNALTDLQMEWKKECRK